MYITWNSVTSFLRKMIYPGEGNYLRTAAVQCSKPPQRPLALTLTSVTVQTATPKRTNAMLSLVSLEYRILSKTTSREQDTGIMLSFVIWHNKNSERLKRILTWEADRTREQKMMGFFDFAPIFSVKSKYPWRDQLPSMTNGLV